MGWEGRGRIGGGGREGAEEGQGEGGGKGERGRGEGGNRVSILATVKHHGCHGPGLAPRVTWSWASTTGDMVLG